MHPPFALPEQHTGLLTRGVRSFCCLWFFRLFLNQV